MNVDLILLAAIGGYLLGSLSFARIVTALAGPGKRVPEETEAKIKESPHSLRLTTVSATSVSLTAGPRLGFLTYLLDMTKVFIPVLVLKKLYPGDPYYLIAAVTGVAGHVWPIYHRFKGGGGISAIFGGIFAIDWLGVFATSIGGMILGLTVFRDVYLIYYLGLILLIPWLWFRFHDIHLVVYAVVVNILFFLASYPGAKRYYELKRTDPAWKDPKVAWRLWAMGRGILKMMEKLGLSKKMKDEETKPE